MGNAYEKDLCSERDCILLWESGWLSGRWESSHRLHVPERGAGFVCEGTVFGGTSDRLVYFIEEGITRSVFHHNGEDTTTWFSQEGDVTFGMDSLYYQQPSVESVETLSDCKIYVIHIDKLNALYETYIDIANWGRILHQNVNKELSHMFVERLQLSPKERYEQFNRRYPGLINRVKLKYVAAFLGISIYTLSRVRAKK